MRINADISLKNVQDVYSGAEGNLWELIMGEQIHIGGLTSSTDLANKANIASGSRGVDLCCCSGAGMRFLVRFRSVAAMKGVDATPKVIEQGQLRCQSDGSTDQISFIQAPATATGLDGASADFVWGEDAWCYVQDKPALIAEAARIVKTGGTIAFTDWVEGPGGLADEEALRFMQFMKFPTLESLDGYQKLLQDNRCEVIHAENTGRYVPCMDLYLTMLDKQLTYDALRIIGFDMDLMQWLAGEMAFIQQLAHADKIIQGLFVARKL